ncbi:MAG: outer membrane beta-barrel protein [Pseudomonadota bacterium]
MIKTILVSSVATLSAFGMAAAGEAGTSKVSVGYLAIDGDGATVGSIVGRYNYSFTDNFGIEGEISTGIVEDDINGVDVSANFGYGIFATGSLPVSDNGSDIFARVGYGSIELEGEAGGLSVTEDADGFAFGVGTNIMVAPQHGIRLDYTRLEGDDAEADTYSVAYVFKF